MPLTHPSSPPDKSQSWKLPPIRAVVGNDTELKVWRENLYRSMTIKSSDAISVFLSRRAQAVEMMKTLNGGGDRTKKSPWATLQAIIRYKKGYANNTEITTDDLRAELENIDRDFSLKNTDRVFSSQRTVADIIQEIKETAAATQSIEDNKLLTITIAGFEMPIVGSVRKVIMDLLQESRNTKETPIPEKLIPEKPIEKFEPLTPPTARVAAPMGTLRGAPPRTIDAVAIHQIGVAVVQRLRTPPSHPYPERPRSPVHHTTPLSHQPSVPYHQHVQRPSLASNLETDRRTIIEDSGKCTIINQALSQATKRREKTDWTVFENYIRSKDMSILTALQAIKRLGNHKNWESVLKYIFSENTLPHPPLEKLPTPIPPSISTPPAKIITETNVMLKAPPITPPSKPILPVTPPTTAPSKPVIPKVPTPLPPVTKIAGEPQSYEALALQILENNEWMTFLRTLCGFHTNRRYAQFFDGWYAFQHNEYDDMQIDIWDALQECRAAKNNPNEGALHIAFELCESSFTPEDGHLYTIRYNRKKRIPELLKANDGYQDLLDDLKDIHKYQDLFERTSKITLPVPLDADNWLLYEEKISPKPSLTDFVAKWLHRKIPGGVRTVEGSVYLRTAKGIIQSLGTKGSG